MHRRKYEIATQWVILLVTFLPGDFCHIITQKNTNQKKELKQEPKQKKLSLNLNNRTLIFSPVYVLVRWKWGFSVYVTVKPIKKISVVSPFQLMICRTFCSPCCLWKRQQTNIKTFGVFTCAGWRKKEDNGIRHTRNTINTYTDTRSLNSFIPCTFRAWYVLLFVLVYESTYEEFVSCFIVVTHKTADNLVFVPSIGVCVYIIFTRVMEPLTFLCIVLLAAVNRPWREWLSIVLYYVRTNLTIHIFAEI